MSYQCACGGPLVSVPINIVEKGVVKGTVCYKQWCPSCGNSRLTSEGEILYYVCMGNGNFTVDRMQFWCPESVPFRAKGKFIDSVLKLANEHRFEEKQYFTIEQVRSAYKESL